MKMFVLLAYAIINGQVTLSHSKPGVYGYYSNKSDCERMAYQWGHRNSGVEYRCEPVRLNKEGK